MLARIIAVGVAYFVYRGPGDDRIVAGLLLGGGFLLIEWAAIDRFMLPRTRRSDLVQIGTAAVGLALMGLGIVRL